MSDKLKQTQSYSARVFATPKGNCFLPGLGKSKQNNVFVKKRCRKARNRARYSSWIKQMGSNEAKKSRSYGTGGFLQATVTQKLQHEKSLHRCCRVLEVQNKPKPAEHLMLKPYGELLSQQSPIIEVPTQNTFAAMQYACTTFLVCKMGQNMTLSDTQHSGV